jgi:tRNA-splicing ligase RtcB (3'-phosphate/5'-hydroxy nucleic acid ligase)
MKPRQLLEMGFDEGPVIGLVLAAWPAARAALGEDSARGDLAALAASPEAFTTHVHFGEAAAALLEWRNRRVFTRREHPAPYRVWGSDIDSAALSQMAAAASLPVTVRGALMPDAHVGYGLPIGGVLATRGAVIPYAVGVDIACRMRLTVFPLPASTVDRQHDRLRKILERETVFGTGATQRTATDHPVLDDDWSFSPVVRRVREKATGQIGTSGSGNHFVEWGTLEVHAEGAAALDVESGSYLALLSHSGSRGPGAMIADFFSRLAMDLHPELPADLRRLAWLDLDSDAGREYWAAMELMGRFAAANHEVIHRKVARALGEDALACVENHHNFAWKERHDGEDLVVHRKGATPAGAGVLGVIPGSMAAPGFVVRGRGQEASLDSASHGAGRRMSRTAARQQFRWSHLRGQLEEAKVTLLSAGIDEAPPAYKDIHAVMAAQHDLVEILARFDPRIVRMADATERPED